MIVAITSLVSFASQCRQGFHQALRPALLEKDLKDFLIDYEQFLSIPQYHRNRVPNDIFSCLGFSV